MSRPSPAGSAPRRAAGVCVTALALLVLLTNPAVAGAAGSAPLPGATVGATGAWAVVPMGQLSDPLNTFWQLLKGGAGSSAWSVVTPEGVADNGGIVAASSGAEVVVGFLPSGQLHYSPLSLSTDGGTSWNPAFLPGALAARPDALAAGPGPAGVLAIVGTRVLQAPPTLATWSGLASLAALGAAGGGCDPAALDAVAFTPSGAPMVATSCTRGGRVGLFTRSAGRWVPTSFALSGRLRRATTAVLALASGASITTALVAARGAHGTDLLTLWQSAAGAWSASAPRPLPAGTAVDAAATGPGGALAVLVTSGRARSVYQASPKRPWVRLPSPPAGTVAVASTPPATPVFAAAAADAFVVHGTELRVYALTPAGPTWALTQTTQVPLAYGSSS